MTHRYGVGSVSAADITPVGTTGGQSVAPQEESTNKGSKRVIALAAGIGGGVGLMVMLALAALWMYRQRRGARAKVAPSRAQRWPPLHKL